jgi:hypothetical protein
VNDAKGNLEVQRHAGGLEESPKRNILKIRV